MDLKGLVNNKGHLRGLAIGEQVRTEWLSGWHQGEVMTQNRCLLFHLSKFQHHVMPHLKNKEKPLSGLTWVKRRDTKLQAEIKLLPPERQLAIDTKLWWRRERKLYELCACYRPGFIPVVLLL